MTDNVLVRGTTPSLIVDFSDITDFAVAEITAAAFTIKRREGTEQFGLSDLIISENTLAYHWTQEQTLAYKTGEFLSLDLHVLANGERYKVRGIPEHVRVANTYKNEVM